MSDFLHDISKSDAAGIRASRRKPFSLGSKGRRSGSRVTKILPACAFAFLWVLAASKFSTEHNATRTAGIKGAASWRINKEWDPLGDFCWLVSVLSSSIQCCWPGDRKGIRLTNTCSKCPTWFYLAGRGQTRINSQEERLNRQWKEQNMKTASEQHRTSSSRWQRIFHRYRCHHFKIKYWQKNSWTLLKLVKHQCYLEVRCHFLWQSNKLMELVIDADTVSANSAHAFKSKLEKERKVKMRLCTALLYIPTSKSNKCSK